MEDPEVAGGIGLRRVPSPERTHEWIERALADPSIHAFAIVAGERHVGNLVLDQVDEHVGSARLSIYIGEPDARGRGFAGEALRLAAMHAREELGLYKLWLTVARDNEPALAAYRRAGYRLEGVLTGEFVYAGRRSDAVRMGLILGDEEA